MLSNACLLYTTRWANLHSLLSELPGIALCSNHPSLQTAATAVEIRVGSALSSPSPLNSEAAWKSTPGPRAAFPLV